MSTVSEIVSSVTRMFGDESGVQIQQADIIRWINEGMRNIVMQNESLFLKSDVLGTVANQQLYSLPVDMLILRGVKFRENASSPYYTIKGYDLAKFDELVDGWEGSVDQGSPAAYTVVDTSAAPQVFGVYPKPLSTDPSGFKITYNRLPVEVTTGTDVPELPIIYHTVLIKHCIQQAYELDEDWDAAGNKASELDRDINLLRGREEWKTQETFPTITVLQDDL